MSIFGLNYPLIFDERKLYTNDGLLIIHESGSNCFLYWLHQIESEMTVYCTPTIH